MRVVRVRNVSEAWARLAETLHGATEEKSRAGAVLVSPEPVTTVYERPRERVLFCPRRNANPFFHLVEALWMLAGRSDAAPLNHYVRDFGSRFAEPDGTIHGAYGHRWRHALGYDQLSVVVEKLRSNPRDRQAVIQMWDASEVTDLNDNTFEGCDDLRGEWRDRPCNTHVYLRIVDRPAVQYAVDFDPSVVGDKEVFSRRLEMTVLCRSNDAIWGAYGANAVHFSMLQEYLAARIGVEVGLLYQVSNNFHVYQDVWQRMRPTDEEMEAAESSALGCMPMFEYPGEIDRDLWVFMTWHGSYWQHGPGIAAGSYKNEWFSRTAERVVRAWHSYRAVRIPDAALSMAYGIECPAWRTACVEWLQRRGAE